MLELTVVMLKLYRTTTISDRNRNIGQFPSKETCPAARGPKCSLKGQVAVRGLT